MIAEADETFAQTRFRFVVRKASRTDACGRQTRRKFIQAVHAGDFFDEIDFALDIGAPGWLRAFPRRQERICGAAILVNAFRSKA